MKTQGSLPTVDAALVLLFGVVGGQIKLRRIDGWRKIVVVLARPRYSSGMIALAVMPSG